MVERVISVMRELAYGLARLTWITSGYGWLALVVPTWLRGPATPAAACPSAR